MPQTDVLVTLDNDDDDEIIPMTNHSSKNSKRTRLTFPFGACRVCSDSATGIHYGIATCEGCKGFFKRSILRKEKYRCYFDSSCLVNVTNRNRCKACRFRRCIDQGMSVDAVKMGRIPKLVKERALKELKEQQLKQQAANKTNDDVNGRESSCSSLSDRSVENYDPNPMETDFLQVENSPLQNLNSEKKLSSIHHENKMKSSFVDLLPENFSVDETEDVFPQNTGYLSSELLNSVQSIGEKLSSTRLNTLIDLTEEESKLIDYLRWSSFELHRRYSKRREQLISRMNQMIEQNIGEYPGEQTTLTQFFNSVRLTCQVYTHAAVVYIQEIPGMTNLTRADLQKLIFQHAFDFFLLKYHPLYHDNGQSYVLAPNGLQITRQWMDLLHGKDLSESIFDFSRCFRQLKLTEAEFALVLPLQMYFCDSIIDDGEILRRLRSCYLYALYTELCRQRGEIEGKQMCSRILHVLDLLKPVNELYRKDAASRILEA